MKLIVDGPDGGGKSTVIERLGLERMHLKSLRGGVGGTTLEGWAGADDAPVAYARKMIEAPPGTAFDRFYLSELLYGPMLRGASAVTDEEVVLVQRVERALGIHTVICLPSYGRTLQNVMQDGRERPVYQTPAFLRGAYEGWVAMADRFPRARRFNYETDTLPVLADMGSDPQLPAAIIGSPRATHLVVTTDHLYLPAFSMKDPAAATLNRALWYAGWNEESLAFTNAYHWAEHTTGAKQALLSTFKVIVAVGIEAAEQLSKHWGIENTGMARAPFMFTVSDPRHTTVPQLTDTLMSIGKFAASL